MGLLPTLLALGLGVFLGLRGGGRLDNLLDWRPPLWQVLAGGVGMTVLLDLLPWSGWFVSFLRIATLGALVFFAVVNVRVGGMVVVAAGLGLNLLVTLLNWGMPVSPSALVSAGVVSRSEVPNLVLTGGRKVADGAVLGFLGGTIPLPWGHVLSIGDVLVLVGMCLVASSVVRRYEVRAASPFGPIGGGRGPAPRDYRDALDALGRGPAPRKGPGLHPSRMAGPRGQRRRTRSGPRPATRPGPGPDGTSGRSGPPPGTPPR
ncbi:MAG: DUF5317 family protein [Actinomycetes bacterium]